MSLAAALNDFSNAGVLIAWVAGLVFSVVLAYVWMVLPFTIVRHFRTLIDESRRQTALLEQIVKQNTPPGAAPPSAVGSYNPLAGPSEGLGVGAAFFIILGIGVAIAVAISIAATR